MKLKYCLPIIKKSKKEVLQEISQNLGNYDLFEVWIDYIKDLDEEFLLEISKKYSGKIIILFRRQNLEKIRISLEKRCQIISLLSKQSVHLDLDFLTQHKELIFLTKQSGKIKLILSYHNYKETPKLDFLMNIISKMKKYNPFIFKVATLCQKPEDNLILLNLLLDLKKQNLKFIVLGMDDMGIISRIVGGIWANEMNFAPKNIKNKSAKGQLTKKWLELIVEAIHGR